MMRYQKFSLATAALLTLTSCGFVKTAVQGGETGNAQSPPGAAIDGTKFFAAESFERFANCKEVSEYQAFIRQEAAKYWSGARSREAAADKSPASKAMNTDGQTNLQVAGVDESDMIKVSENQIFIKRPTSVVVLDRKTRVEIGQISTHGTARDMYLDNGKLILVGTKLEYRRADQLSTTLDIYTLDPGKLPLLEKSLSFDGMLLESRIRDGQLIFTAQVVLSDSTPVGDTHLTMNASDSPSERHLACGDIIKPTHKGDYYYDGSIHFSVIYSVSLRDEDNTHHSLALDRVKPQIFMSKDQILVSSLTYGDVISSSLSQIAIEEDGRLVPRSIGIIPGQINNKWALFATTIDMPVYVVTSGEISFRGSTGNGGNRIYALQGGEKAWTVLSGLKDIAPGETVRAVRFADGLAYIVTFKKTDPLFTVDLSDPTALQLKGELKVPGFSTQLHPLGDGRLLGIGYDAQEMGDFALFQGLQISLFDALDISRPTRLDVKVIGGWGSSSESQYDHHAVYYDDQTKLLGVPFVEYGKSDQPDGWWQVSHYVDSGAVFYNIAHGTLAGETRQTLRDLLPEACKEAYKNNRNEWWQNQTESLFDVRRILDLDGEILTVSNFGLKSFTKGSMTLRSQVTFGQNEALCLKLIESLTPLGCG